MNPSTTVPAEPDTTPDLTALTAAVRALLAAGWKGDYVYEVTDGTAYGLIHPTGREISATVHRNELVTLALHGLTLDQAVGAVVGAGLAPAAEVRPEHYYAAGSTGGPGACSAVCICGTAVAGFDTVAEAVAVLDQHIANPDGTSEPDYWLNLADDLRIVADRIATLAGTTPTPGRVWLNILGSVLPSNAGRMVPLVDAIAAAFDGTAGTDVRNTDQHSAQIQIGAVDVHPYTYVPDRQESELEQLRADNARLTAALEATQGGTR